MLLQKTLHRKRGPASGPGSVVPRMLAPEARAAAARESAMHGTANPLLDRELREAAAGLLPHHSLGL